MIAEMCSEDAVRALCNDQYGNYVIQCAVEVADTATGHSLVEALRYVPVADHANVGGCRGSLAHNTVRAVMGTSPISEELSNTSGGRRILAVSPRCPPYRELCEAKSPFAPRLSLTVRRVSPVLHCAAVAETCETISNGGRRLRPRRSQWRGDRSRADFQLTRILMKSVLLR